MAVGEVRKSRSQRAERHLEPIGIYHRWSFFSVRATHNATRALWTVSKTAVSILSAGAPDHHSRILTTLRTAEKAELKSFARPDDVRGFPKGRLELVTIGDATIGRAVFEPRATTDKAPSDRSSVTSPLLDQISLFLEKNSLIRI